MYAYCHIPKTGGTTFSYLLEKNFGTQLQAVITRDASTYSYNDLKKDRLIYGNAKCISGHGLKPFIDYKEYNKEMQWITFLRDPIQRFISQYIHQQTGSISQYHLSIEKWAAKYARSNWQVKWIAGEEDLEAAKQIIMEKFFFVGLTEQFDASLQFLRDRMEDNFDIQYSKPKRLVRDSSLKLELTKSRYQELESIYLENNQLDIGLYNFVNDNIFKKYIRNSNKLFNSSDANEARFKTNLKCFKLKRDFIYKPFVYLTK